ncbi:MAG: ribosomal L28 family protein [Chloroflexi bacterium]|nr:bL28 family ribosomal protein [Chloroflexota bacterium]MQC18938.1 ribosomal L28 family protein [Chloroflexota bacterium]
MAAGKCDLCEKHVMFGRNIRHKHSGNWERKAPRTNRTFKPNVVSKKVFLDGTWQRKSICTRCLRTQAKHMSEKGLPVGLVRA